MFNKTLNVILLMIIISLSIFLVRSKNQNKKDNTTVISVLIDSTKFWISKYGNEHATNEVVNADLSVWKLRYDSLFKKSTKELGIKENQITNLNYIVVGLKNTIHGKDTFIVLQNGDTVDNEANDENGYIEHLTNGYYNYGCNVHLMSTKYWTRCWFLGIKTYHDDLYSPDKNVKILEYDAISIKHKEESRFSLGIHAGINTHAQFDISIGLNFDLIRPKNR